MFSNYFFNLVVYSNHNLLSILGSIARRRREFQFVGEGMVISVRLFPTKCQNDGCAGAQLNQGRPFVCSGRFTEKWDKQFAGVLVRQNHDYLVIFKASQKFSRGLTSREDFYTGFISRRIN